MTNQETILFADDEEVVLEVGAGILKRLGYSVFAAKSPADALDIFHEHHPAIDLVILDMVMPGMSCDELFDRIKQIRPDVRVLLASGYSLNGQVRNIMERGCDGFIQKPFKVADLAKKIREILDKDQVPV